jgi:hypothetical protein
MQLVVLLQNTPVKMKGVAVVNYVQHQYSSSIIIIIIILMDPRVKIYRTNLGRARDLESRCLFVD